MRYALRTLVRQPLFTLGAIATLALGIGVNSTIFTLANAAFAKPMPGLAQPDALVWLSSVWRDRGREVGMSFPDFADYRDGTSGLFVDLFAFRPAPFSLGSGGDPQRIKGHIVTGSYFTALGVTPAAGRLLGADDDRSGAPARAVISHRLWQDRFAASSEVLSTTLTLNGRSFAIVGVAPEHFSGPALGEPADVWVPMAFAGELRPADRSLLTERGASWLLVMGQLRDDASIRGAQAATSEIARRLEQAHAETNANKMVTVSSAATGLPPAGRAELMPLSALLLTVTGLVLLIACANVANLLLARGAGRALEMSIRAAIGASRRHLLRQLLTESALLATAGAGAGLIVSFWASDLLLAQLPASEFRGFQAGADARVLLFTALLALVSVCAFGLVPALTASRGALLPRLRETPSSGGRSRLQGAFVVAQLALSLVLLLAGGLSLRALQKAGSIDLGFNPQGVITASYDLELQNYAPERRAAFRRDLRIRLAALPGVTAVGIANVPPLSGTMVSTVVETQDPKGGTAEGRAYLNGVGPGYFEALQITLMRGRAFSETDTTGSTPSAIVNETLARNLWGATDPIGRPLTLGRTTLQVIGVVRDSKYDEATEDPRPFLYTSLDQAAQLDRETVLLRTATSPGGFAAPIQSVLRSLDPAMPVFDVRTMEDVLKERADKERGISALLGAFGAVALLLAALGLYGVMSYAVTRRTREMGIRLALGATPAQLSSLIARDGLRLALIGAGIGATLAVPMAGALGALLFGVQIADLAAFGGTCALLIGVAVVASLLPARRATRVDPIVALRAE